jgi:hypothetical protein
MVKKKEICLLLCLVLGFGCTTVQTEMTKRITIAPAAERTICIQTDPAITEMAQIIIPLETELGSKGYRIVATPEQAAYTLRLELVNFGLRGRPPVPQASPPAGPVEGNGFGERPMRQSAPVVGSAAGTAIGGAVSGSALHAGLTTGGAVGGLAGLGVGLLLGGGSSPNYEPFIGKVNVSIIDSLLRQPAQQTELTARAKVRKESQIPAAQKAVAEKLAAQIAALMP